jgi:hypothetical protein
MSEVSDVSDVGTFQKVTTEPSWIPMIDSNEFLLCVITTLPFTKLTSIQSAVW